MSQNQLPPTAAATGAAAHKAKYCIAFAALAALALGGCSSKNYVRQQTAPLMNRVNNLDAETAKNSNAIRDVRSSTEKGIARVNSTSQQAIQQAQTASSDASKTADQLGQTSQQVRALDATVANLDNYHLSYQDAVHFAFNKWNLTPASQATLDQIAQRMQQDPHAILEVQGYTDATGPAAYNYKLSEWRADSVVRYLEDKGLPPHRIFLIGLGKNQFVATNATASGRQQNRRVDLKVMVNSLGNASEASGQGQASSQPAAAPQQP